MLGLADSNDPTPPMSRGRLWGIIVIVLGVADAVYGAIRVVSNLEMGLIFLASGVLFIALGVTRVIVSRRAPGSDGGTADRP